MTCIMTIVPGKQARKLYESAPFQVLLHDDSSLIDCGSKNLKGKLPGKIVILAGLVRAFMF
jgi:hypothetical protein